MFKLNYDLLHHILRFCDDLKTINLLKLTCKLLYSSCGKIIDKELVDYCYVEHTSAGIHIYSLSQVMKIKLQENINFNMLDVLNMTKSWPVIDTSYFHWGVRPKGYVGKRTAFFKY